MAPREGVVTGYLLKVIRESIGLNQVDLAAHLDVDKNTVQGWESGRRGLTNTRVGGFLDLRRELRMLGAQPALLALVDPAVEADRFLAEGLRTDPKTSQPKRHPLATLVIKRTFAELLAWPFTGTAPTSVIPYLASSRRGPTPSAPQVSAPERSTFFEHLREAADRSSRRGSTAAEAAGVQLRRQVYYLAAWDPSGDTRRWLQDNERVEQRRRLQLHGWTPEWAARRTLVIARARQGDREPLQAFIATGMNHDELEAANLNYWAYWIEETPAVEHADEFMATDLGSWGGAKLLRRLHDSLTPEESVIDLCVHSIWALLQRRPWLLAADPELGASLYTRVHEVADTAKLSARAREEVQQIRYGMQINQPFRP